MDKRISLLIVGFFLTLFLTSMVSALDWDNKKQFTLDDTTSKYGRIEIYNSFFLGLGIGTKLWQAELKLNTDTCGEFCSAEKEITIYKDGVLIDDVKFETIKKDGSRVEQDIRSYQFYILQNGIKIPYEIGTNVKAGTYQVILEGHKKPSRTVDWQIESNGKWTEEWAVWSSIGRETTQVYDDFDDITIDFSKWFYGNGNTGNSSESDGVLHLGIEGSNTVKVIISNLTFYQLGYNVTIRINDSTTPGGGGTNCIVLFNESQSSVSIGQVEGTDASCLGATQNVGQEGNYTFYKYNETAIRIITPTDTQIISIPWSLDSLKIGLRSNWGSPNKFDIGFVNYGLQSVFLNSPENNTMSSTNIIEFNCSLYQPDATIVNGSILTNVSGSLEIVNTTTGLSGNFQGINLSYTFVSDGNYLWTCQGCDSDGDCGFADTNRTIIIDTTIPEITINLPTALGDYAYVGENKSLNWTYTDLHLGSCWYDYNGADVDVNCTEGNATFVLEKDNYNMTFYANDSANNLNTTFFNWTYRIIENSRNFSTSSYETETESYKVNVTSNSSLTATSLIYGGASYTSILSGETYSTTITHTTNGTNQFYWNFTYGGNIISSYTSNQTVSNIEFNICNFSDALLNTTFLNITFLDEETLIRVGAQIDTSTFTSWLGDGSVTESLVYSNLTNMSEYDFCFTPSDRTMENDISIQYSATGYPQRKYDDDTALTSTTTHKILYLLSSSHGIYSTIQVVDENGDIVSGADVTMERQFSGVWTIIGKETSDGAGAVTFWVNPDYDHRFTLEKTGCVTNTETVRPTQTTYTATINCLGVSDEIYVAPIEGIKYFLLPASGLITTGMQNFSFQVVSSKDNIVNAKFEIVNGSGYVLDSLSSACAAAGCTISKLYNVTSAQKIKGKYYVDLGDGYILLEADARWIEVNIPVRDGTFKQFWLNLRSVFDEWHEEGEDITNTSDFNRIVFIFLFLAIGIATFNKLTHFDSSHPGAFLIFLTAVIFAGSIAGHPDNGFFYLDNLTMAPFINNYLITGLMLWMLISHYAGVQLAKNR